MIYDSELMKITYFSSKGEDERVVFESSMYILRSLIFDESSEDRYGLITIPTLLNNSTRQKMENLRTDVIALSFDLTMLGIIFGMSLLMVSSSLCFMNLVINLMDASLDGYCPLSIIRIK